MTKRTPASRPEMSTVEDLQRAARDGSLALHLLQINLERLELCKQLEKDRAIVYPEGSVILRDCNRLQNMVAGRPETNDGTANDPTGDW